MKKPIAATVLFSVLAFSAGSQGGSADPQAPGQRNVRFAGPGGVELGGYLAEPEGNGQFPAVLLIHEWWGLNHDTVLLADALAREGFVVLAADAFRGSVARTATDARRQLSQNPQDQIAGDLDAAYAYLAARPKVNSDAIGVMGFCFGGTQSMHMGTRNAGLSSVVIFYGSGPIQSAQRLGTMAQAGPVLGIYGAQDGGIPVSQVRAFEAAMNSSGVQNTVTVYEGVGHAFVKSDTYNRGGTPEAAWRQAVAFLKQNLQ